MRCNIEHYYSIVKLPDADHLLTWYGSWLLLGFYYVGNGIVVVAMWFVFYINYKWESIWVVDVQMSICV